MAGTRLGNQRACLFTYTWTQTNRQRHCEPLNLKYVIRLLEVIQVKSRVQGVLHNVPVWNPAQVSNFFYPYFSQKKQVKAQ